MQRDGNAHPDVPPEPPSAADALIARLGADGRAAEEGRFTWDREKAREKLRRFQLPDAHRYVVELLRAATLCGARRVVAAVGPRAATYAFDGRPFARRDLEQLYDVLFEEDVADDHAQAKLALAVGLNAALALGPRLVTLESGDGGGEARVRLTLNPQRPETVTGEAEHPASSDVVGFPGATTTIRVERGLGARALLGALREAVSPLPEARILAEAARFGDLAVELDGRRVSGGLRLPEALVTVPFSVPGLEAEGLAGFLAAERGQATLTLVQRGVVAGVLPLPEAPPWLAVVVPHDAARLDLSRASVLEDEALAGILGAASKATEPVLTALAARDDLLRNLEDPGAGRARQAIRQALCDVTNPAPLFAEGGGEPPTPLSRALRDAPVWETREVYSTRLREQRLRPWEPVSLARMAQGRRADPLVPGWCLERPESPMPDFVIDPVGARFVQVGTQEEDAFLRRALGPLGIEPTSPSPDPDYYLNDDLSQISVASERRQRFVAWAFVGVIAVIGVFLFVSCLVHRFG